MDKATIILFLDAIIAVGAGFYNLAYLLHWRNGKSLTSAISFILFTYLGVIHFFAFFNVLDRATYGPVYIRPVLPMVYAMIIAHVYIDWKKNQVNKGHLQRAIIDKIKNKKERRKN